MLKKFSTLLVSTAALSSCTPSRDAQCLATGSIPLKPDSSPNYFQGGYIQFNDKKCTATFSVQNIAPEKIILKGYSARHCRFDSSAREQKILLNLFFEKSNKRSEGYIQNIPAKEDFAMRADQLSREIGKLGIVSAQTLFNDALKIAINYNPEGEGTFEGNQAIICNDKDWVPAIDDPERKTTQSCWSFLDLGVFEFEITKSSMKQSDFEFIKDRLSEKKSALDTYLNSNSNLKNSYHDYIKKIDGMVGLMRIQNYARLGYLLSMDMCKITTDSNFDVSPLCNVQSGLIELAGRYLVESDETGNKVNIFDKLSQHIDPFTGQIKPNESGFGISLANLRAGRRLGIGSKSITFSNADEIANGFANEIRILYKNLTSKTIYSFKSLIKEHSPSHGDTKISPVLFVSTNYSSASSVGKNDIRFGHFPLTSTSRLPQKILVPPPLTGDVFGIGPLGTLRMAIPHEHKTVNFSRSDSGSLLSFKGFLPLMVLNTVDDEPTSGGASILALPEAKAEEIPTSNKSSGKFGNNPKSKAEVTADSDYVLGGVPCL